MPTSSRPSRGTLFIGTLVAMAVHVFVVGCEAALAAGGIGFSENPGWIRLIGALADVGPEHFSGIRPEAWEIVAWAGMLAALAAGLIRRPLDKRWALAAYGLVLLASGGWMGVLMMPYLPSFLLFRLHEVDGEFFIDLEARMLACGLWTTLVLAWTAVAFLTGRRKESTPPAQ